MKKQRQVYISAVWQWDLLFWQTKNHKQRITAKRWREVLLEERDTLIKKGTLRQLVATNLGYGVVEVSLKPLEVE